MSSDEKRNRLADLLSSASVILADGGIETRLKYEFGIPLPEFASFLPLFDEAQRPALEAIYRSYIAIAVEFRRTMQVGTPTWRAHPECLKRLGFKKPEDLHRVNAQAVALLQTLKSDGAAHDLVVIAGVIGPRRDGYDPHNAPSADEAHRYHAAQAEVLAALGVDLLYAPTFASAAELRGVARAMAATGLPYALAPVVDASGRMLDGNPLADVIKLIDETVDPPPLHYLVGCVHPTHFGQAFKVIRGTPVAGSRLIGLKANASTLPPEELNRLDHLDAGQVTVSEKRWSLCAATTV